MQYTIKNDKITAVIESVGAELYALRNADGKEYLWNGDSRFWARRSPILFPFVGRLKDGKYHYQGKEYAMGIHGFAKDMEFTCFKEAADEIWFALEATEESKQLYPFDFRLEIGYRLIENTLHVMWKVKNPMEKETLHFSIGAHPGFLCPLDEGAERSQYYLEFDVKEEVEYHSANMENGLRLPDSRIMELENGRCRIRDGFFDMGDRGTYIIENNQVKKVSLIKPDGTPYVTVKFDMPIVALWSAEGKNAPYVCIEPWCGRCDDIDFAGSLEERPEGNAIESGEVFETTYEISIF